MDREKSGGTRLDPGEEKGQRPMTPPFFVLKMRAGRPRKWGTTPGGVCTLAQSKGIGSGRPDVIPPLPLPRSVTLGKLLCVPEPRFPHLAVGMVGAPSSGGHGEEYPTAKCSRKWAEDIILNHALWPAPHNPTRSWGQRVDGMFQRGGPRGCP